MLILKQFLDDRNITIAELQSKIKEKGNYLSRTSLSNILNDKNSPSVDNLEIIAEALNINIRELFQSEIQDQFNPIYIKDETGNFKEIGYLKK